MPIIVKDFTWKQTEDRVTIEVPMHGVPVGKADIFTSSRYIKASFEMVIFEAILLNPIVTAESICTQSSSFILFDLRKCSKMHWESLEIENISKEEKQRLKVQFIADERESRKKQAEERINKKAQLKRISVSGQIELDTQTRHKIDSIKELEEKKALGDLDQWREQMDGRQHTAKIVEINDESEEEAPNVETEYELKPNISDFKRNNDLDRKLENVLNKSIQCRSRKLKKQSEKKENPQTPKPRNNRALQILFTPREFPTPSRESRLDEENEFLAKQAETRRSAGFIKEDLRAEEKNPQFLLAKGREFQKNKNYIGAISAYSFGIKISPKFLDLYMARSESHMLTGNFYNATKDCSSALDLLKPILPINLDDRSICMGRRGISLFKLGFHKQGISELEASLKLKKDFQFQDALDQFKAEYERIKSESEKEDKK